MPNRYSPNPAALRNCPKMIGKEMILDRHGDWVEHDDWLEAYMDYQHCVGENEDLRMDINDLMAEKEELLQTINELREENEAIKRQQE